MNQIAYAFDVREVEFSAVRSSGAGGQNVNKVSTAVCAKLNLRRSALPLALKNRIQSLFPNRVSAEGDLVVKAQEYRTQERNKVAAIARLADIIERSSFLPTKRIRTKPTRASVRKRLQEKAHRSKVKAERRLSWRDA